MLSESGAFAAGVEGPAVAFAVACYLCPCKKSVILSEAARTFIASRAVEGPAFVLAVVRLTFIATATAVPPTALHSYPAPSPQSPPAPPPRRRTSPTPHRISFATGSLVHP